MKGGRVFMKFYQDMIDEAVELLNGNKLPYANSIIIGDNASGKSVILKNILIKNEKLIYFIDAINRTFNIKKVNSPMKNFSYSDKILKSRLLSENFNLRDSWSYYGTETECIELIYHYYEKKLQELFKEFTGNSFEIVTEESQDVRYNSGDIGKISNGYQAITRILLELLYFDDKRPKKTEQRALVVIDEIDEYLSPTNSGGFYLFLREKFNDIDFIVATHSAEIIAAANECNILILQESGLEVLDAGDFRDIDDAIMIFKSVFGRQKSKENKYDSLLRQLLNNRITGVWGISEENLLKTIDEAKLTKTQKVLYRQIKGW